MLTNDPRPTRPSFTLPAAFRLSALALFAGVSTLALHAQATSVVAADAQPSQLVADLTVPPPSLASLSGINYSSSSSSVDTPVDAAAAEGLNLSAGMQPPPRRRYGRPRYNDSSHNPDGSSKYEFVLGAGFTGPVGNTYHYLNTSYGLQFGGGRDWNKYFGVLMQFDYERFGMNGRTLTNELAIYDFGVSTNSADYISQLDGNSHVWSFTLNPHYNFIQGQSWGVYGVAGAGFFHKVANFTTPETGEGYSPYYGYYEYTANEVIDHYSSNAPGFNLGGGLTYKPSRFAGERLFGEVRYNLVLNSQRTGLTVQNFNRLASTYSGTDYYPANSNRTTFLAYKFGIRF